MLQHFLPTSKKCSCPCHCCTPSPPRLVGFLYSLFHTLMRFSRRFEEISQNFEAFHQGSLVPLSCCLHRHDILSCHQQMCSTATCSQIPVPSLISLPRRSAPSSSAPSAFYWRTSRSHKGKSPFALELRDPAAAIHCVHLLSLFNQEPQPLQQKNAGVVSTCFLCKLRSSGHRKLHPVTVFLCPSSNSCVEP